MLLISKVPRALDVKVRLYGFELSDLVLVFFYLALSNLLFGTTRAKFPVVWIGTALLATTLFFVKRGKPDNHLQHYGEYRRTPEVLTAAAPDLDYVPYGPFITEKEKHE